MTLFLLSTDNPKHCTLHPGRPDLVLRLAAHLPLQGGLDAMIILATVTWVLQTISHLSDMPHSLQRTYPVPFLSRFRLQPAPSCNMGTT